MPNFTPTTILCITIRQRTSTSMPASIHMRTHQVMTRNEDGPFGHLPTHWTQWCLSVRFSICPAGHSSSQRPSSRSFQYSRCCLSGTKFNARHSSSWIHRQPRNYTTTRHNSCQSNRLNSILAHKLTWPP